MKIWRLLIRLIIPYQLFDDTQVVDATNVDRRVEIRLYEKVSDTT